MVEYSQAYDVIYNDNTLSMEEEAAAFAELNEQYGYDPESGASQFEDEMTATNFIDTTGIIEMGPNYNVHWGDLNDEVLYERQNQYHKPLMSLRHSAFLKTYMFLIRSMLLRVTEVEQGWKMLLDLVIIPLMDKLISKDSIIQIQLVGCLDRL